MCIFVDKPARLIIRLLFQFDKLNQSTNTETAVLSIFSLRRSEDKHCGCSRHMMDLAQTNSQHLLPGLVILSCTVAHTNRHQSQAQQIQHQMETPHSPRKLPPGKFGFEWIGMQSLTSDNVSQCLNVSMSLTSDIRFSNTSYFLRAALQSTIMLPAKKVQDRIFT